ncbi:hypothetical protein B0H10DRAFT_2211197 [Mycena sp. CBHHK59/15]|nr:hypothetical protein B0H10DRAFT_2211197 [Mycena sp. CBHHK59/15]
MRITQGTAVASAAKNDLGADFQVDEGSPTIPVFQKDSPDILVYLYKRGFEFQLKIGDTTRRRSSSRQGTVFFGLHSFLPFWDSRSMLRSKPARAVYHLAARSCRGAHAPHIYSSVATRSAFRLGRKLTSMGLEWGMQMQIVDPPRLPPRHPAPRLEVPPFPTPASDYERALPISHKMSHNASQLCTGRAEQSAPTPPASSLHLARARSRNECNRADCASASRAGRTPRKRSAALMRVSPSPTPPIVCGTPHPGAFDCTPPTDSAGGGRADSPPVSGHAYDRSTHVPIKKHRGVCV